MTNSNALRSFFKVVKITLIILLFIIAFAGAMLRLYPIIVSIPRNDDKELQLFLECEESFEKVNAYVLENFDLRDGENKRGILVWYDDKKIAYLYESGTKIYPDEEIVSALEVIRNAIKTDFSYIEITGSRVDYLGVGSRMYVYSRNGKAPTYFSAVDDGIRPVKVRLHNGWFLQWFYSR